MLTGFGGGLDSRTQVHVSHIYDDISLNGRIARIARYDPGVEAGVNEALRTWDCKRPDCDGTAYKGSGPYAMLCRFRGR